MSVVRYDDKTQVVYRQRYYSVANLERGDYIAAQTQQDRDGRIYTDSITVRESVQDRGDKRGATDWIVPKGGSNTSINGAARSSFATSAIA